MSTITTLERRYIPGLLELRTSGNDIVFTGHAAKFGTLSSNLGGFVETIEPGAFADTIRQKGESDLNDIRALKNHDPNLIIARQANGTLEVVEDDTGLYWEGTGDGRKNSIQELGVDVERGDINQGSFGFRTIEDSWSVTEQGFPLRTLIKVELYDVSAVTFPAYPDTSAQVRGIALRSFLTHHGVENPAAAELLVAGGKRNWLTILDEFRAGGGVTCRNDVGEHLDISPDGTVNSVTIDGQVYRADDNGLLAPVAGDNDDETNESDDLEGAGATTPSTEELRTRLAAMRSGWADLEREFEDAPA